MEQPLVFLKDRLKYAYSVCGVFVVDAVGIRDFRDRGEILRDAVQLNLNCLHIIADHAGLLIGARPARRHGTDLRCADQVEIFAVVILQNLIRRHALIGQSDCSPLRESLAAGAGAVAE